MRANAVVQMVLAVVIIVVEDAQAIWTKKTGHRPMARSIVRCRQCQEIHVHMSQSEFEVAAPQRSNQQIITVSQQVSIFLWAFGSF